MPVKLQKLAVAGYRQFRETVFDFNDPNTGKPLERVCFLGGNGTGKSTILRLLWEVLGVSQPAIASKNLKLLAAMTDGEAAWSRFLSYPPQVTPLFVMGENFESIWKALPDPNQSRTPLLPARTGKVVDPNTKDYLTKQLISTTCLHCPPDSELLPASKKISDVPKSSMNDALSALKKPKTRVLVGQETIAEFWTNLIALIKDREARLLACHRLPENKNRTIQEVEAEFLRENPDILKELADFWNVLLERAGLEFDYEGAAVPIQLTDNLKAYIRLKHDRERIGYAELSTGIRNFIFKLGHIFTIFRGNPATGGIILVDEPENSLHPDFLFDLVSHYQRAAPGAQLFMATHSPIIAAQFKPEERFILEFDTTGAVSVRNGVSPEGDDPNDLLVRDFAVRTLYGREGLEKWRRFRELDRMIHQETDSKTRRRMMQEFMDIGRAYNFAPEHEIPA